MICAHCGAWQHQLDATGAVCSHPDGHEMVCSFCESRPLIDARTWATGRPRPAPPCPRCGETHAAV